jgi:hypothetical protein
VPLGLLRRQRAARRAEDVSYRTVPVLRSMTVVDRSPHRERVDRPVVTSSPRHTQEVGRPLRPCASTPNRPTTAAMINPVSLPRAEADRPDAEHAAPPEHAELSSAVIPCSSNGCNSGNQPKHSIRSVVQSNAESGDGGSLDNQVREGHRRRGGGLAPATVSVLAAASMTVAIVCLYGPMGRTARLRGPAACPTQKVPGGKLLLRAPEGPSRGHAGVPVTAPGQLWSYRS